MSGLLDFLQAASNTAAGTVSGPVDLLNMLLGKAGVPVSQTPVGGSAWMEKKGLTRPVQQGVASVAGETVGLLTPAVAAKYAPQIAKGLLQAGENMAAPATLSPQKGAIVWHGSPHKFDRFDSSKIGTGEGAQAYGHGLYLADAPDVAAGYQKRLSQGSYAGDGGVQSSGSVFDAAMQAAKDAGASRRDHAYAIAKSVQDWVDSGRKAETFLRRHDVPADHKLAYQAVVDQFSGKAIHKGNLYKVDLPDTAIAKMLDWDKPLSQQAPEVRPTLQAMLEKIKALPDSSLARGERAYLDNPSSLKGADIYNMHRRYFGGDSVSGADASSLLRQQGIPGIRYLDGGSRGAGAGTSNYVVFPGEEGLLKILERNGAPL